MERNNDMINLPIWEHEVGKQITPEMWSDAQGTLLNEEKLIETIEDYKYPPSGREINFSLINWEWSNNFYFNDNEKWHRARNKRLCRQFNSGEHQRITKRRNVA